ncbi:hypothetical protein JG687_00017749 [Phytophthora cactorum]|uniref:Uncharacterized protein n=1 Tax=Phytophthora cactorum TaxID=29920 RepID=A0A8T1TQL8_9STRA|nr:hypothetical protein JG687_00017749 [Phytophthora cactorum]
MAASSKNCQSEAVSTNGSGQDALRRRRTGYPRLGGGVEEPWYACVGKDATPRGTGHCANVRRPPHSICYLPFLDSVVSCSPQSLHENQNAPRTGIPTRLHKSRAGVRCDGSSPRRRGRYHYSLQCRPNGRIL